MEIREWQRPATRMTIDKFMAIEVPEGLVNQHGHIQNAVNVIAVERLDVEIFIAVGRVGDRYYSGYGVAALEKGSSCDAWINRNHYSGKVNAFKAAIKGLMHGRWVKEFPGLEKNLEVAIKELDKYQYQQLTLF